MEMEDELLSPIRVGPIRSGLSLFGEKSCTARAVAWSIPVSRAVVPTSVGFGPDPEGLSTYNCP